MLMTLILTRPKYVRDFCRIKTVIALCIPAFVHLSQPFILMIIWIKGILSRLKTSWLSKIGGIMACIILSLNSTIAFLARPDKSTEYGDLSMYGTGIGLLFTRVYFVTYSLVQALKRQALPNYLFYGHILSISLQWTYIGCRNDTNDVWFNNRSRGKAEGIAIYSLIICFNMLIFNGFMSQF